MITESAADWIAQAAVQSAGGTFVTPQGTPGFDTAEGREGLELYALPAREGLTDRSGVAVGEVLTVSVDPEHVHVFAGPDGLRQGTAAGARLEPVGAR